MRWLVLVGAIRCAACSSEGAVEPVRTSAATEPSGTVTLHWTLGGRADDGACTDAGAAFIEVAVTAADGRVLTTSQAPCSPLNASLSLAPGSYTARARLLSTNGEPRSTAVDVAPFTVTDADVVVRELVF